MERKHVTKVTKEGFKVSRFERAARIFVGAGYVKHYGGRVEDADRRLGRAQREKELKADRQKWLEELKEMVEGDLSLTDQLSNGDVQGLVELTKERAEMMTGKFTEKGLRALIDKELPKLRKRDRKKSEKDDKKMADIQDAII